MKQKINHNGHCLHCGKESKTPFCNRQCYRDYIKGTYSKKEYEKQQRDSLSDRVVKRTIYIVGKGKIKYNQITPEMIIEKRAQILAHRARTAIHSPKQPKATKYCKICGKVLTNRRDMYCSNECRKIKANKHSLELNKAKMMHKTTKVRLCKECNKPFVSEYGNKRRTFCSIECSDRYADRCKCRNAKKRAKKYGCEYEYINPIKVFVRDGWRCQLCGKQLSKKNRGTIKDNAPELDHIIPISKGGGHLYINTQCACRKCNSDKGNQDRGQIRLFG